jgi:hypothetical protein
MRITPFVTGIVLAGLIAAPAGAQDTRRRGREQRPEQAQEQQRDRRGPATGRAVPRDSVQQAPPRQNESRPEPSNTPRSNQSRGGDYGRNDNNRGYGNNGRYESNGRYDNDGRYDSNGRYGNDRRYGPGRAVGRPYYPYYSNRGYGQRTVIVPRYVRPTIVNVVPYRPYYYRPSIGIGIYYGSGGYYPYGYTPRSYYDPIPGRPYGGLRITGFPRDAQVFADGYYVGIVNDFDGIFQAVNLEAGPHRIEIVEPGYEGIEFDVMIQPGRTTTFRY